MPRLLDNWLETFGEWTVPRSEAPESLIIWSGLFAIASVVKRHVYFPMSLMGSYNIFPNLYIVYVGPPGVVRKSTTAAYSEKLLKRIEHIHIASTAVSASKLVEIMSETIDGTISIISSEFANFVAVSKEEMYDLLTDVYDGKISYELATRMHGVEVVENPCVNMLGATTPGWVSSAMPEYVISGGFTSRTIFLYEDKVRQRRLYYELDWGKYERMEKKLVHDLAWVRDLKGEFRHNSPATRKWIEEWYRSTADVEVADERIEGFASRRHVHAHKVAMLLSLSERDDLVVTQGHFEAAIKLLEAVEKKLPKVFKSVGRNPFAADIDAIHEYIKDRGPVDKTRLMSRFYHNVSPETLKEILSALTKMELIERIPNPNGAPGSVSYKAKISLE